MIMDSNKRHNIMKKQPIGIIGTLGSVADGKSTAVEQLTGFKTQKHSSEKERNITIKTGYRNLRIVRSEGSLKTVKLKKKRMERFNENDLVNHLSILDSPGHHSLIITMLSNIELVSGVIVVIAANDPIDKKPQLIEHLYAAKLSNLPIIICHNKLDLIDKNKAIERYQELVDYLNELEIHPKSIIPTSLSLGYGIDNLISEVLEHFQFEDKSLKKVIFKTNRSFDINKSMLFNNDFDLYKGGVLGGCLINGKIKVGDKIVISPGYIDENKNYHRLKSEILSLRTDENILEEAYPGALIGIGTEIDPILCKDNGMQGQTITLEGDELPEVYKQLKLEIDFTNKFGSDIWDPKQGEIVLLQIGTKSLKSKISDIDGKNINFKLSLPWCCSKDIMIIITTDSETSKILACGKLLSGVTV